MKGTRVYGPYAEGNRWRIVVDVAGEKQQTKRFDTEAEADEEKRKLLAASTAAPKLWDVMRDYFDHIKLIGIKPASVATLKFRLLSFFELDHGKCELADVPITQVDPERCAALYAALAKRMKVDTHRNTLAVAKRFGAWCVKRGTLPTNPIATVEPVGRRKRGKEQLRVDEARRFLAACEKHAVQGDAGAIAAMTALLLGMRASEVVDRVVRDLDDDGRLLWIPDAKTPAGRRTLEVPDALRARLQMLAEGKAQTDRLFTNKDRHWVLYHVRRMCRAAGIPEITSHSLRGLHSTLAMDHGSTGRLVASALGHTTFAITKRHYVAPGTVERAARKRVGAMLDRRDAPAPAARPEPTADASQEWAGW